jgi:formin 2
VKVLDSKRSQEIGIFIKSNHLDINDVENTIYNFDNSIVSVETLIHIRRIKACVTDDELNVIQSNSDKVLDSPEQFVFDLSHISHFDDRLECFMFQSRFVDLLADIEHRLNNVNDVCDQLLNSSSVKDVMSIVLACGNYMNGGNMQRGQADGFAIDILPKLKDVKSKDNTTTLLQYIVRFGIIKYDPKKGTRDAKLPVPEPSDVERSANMNFEDQKLEISKLKSQLDKIETAKENVVNNCDEEHLEPFQEKMTGFLEKASTNLNELNDLISECSQKFINTMKFYHFNPKEGRLETAQPRDFFSIWYPFCQDYKNLWKREQARIEKQILAEERLKHKKKSETLKSFKTEALKPKGLKEKMLRRKSKLNGGN